MVSHPHELALEILEGNTQLLPRLLQQILGVQLPQPRAGRIAKADARQLIPTEYRADLVIEYGGRKPILCLIVEIQLTKDWKKRFTWPLYAAATHAKKHCTTLVVVLTPSRAIARWARQRCETFQPPGGFAPLVLGPDEIPRVTDPRLVAQDPDLASLSAAIHGRKKKAFELGLAAHEGLRQATKFTPQEKTLYWDHIFAALSKAAQQRLREWLDMRVENHPFVSDWGREAYGRGMADGQAKGKVEGKAEGKAEALLAILSGRGLTVGDAPRRRILACKDIRTLDRWITRAASGATLSKIFAR